MQWTGQQPTFGGIQLPHYRVFNVSLQQRINQRFRWHVGIDNLTNLRLADTSSNFGYAIRGRVLDAGVQFGF